MKLFIAAAGCGGGGRLTFFAAIVCLLLTVTCCSKSTMLVNNKKAKTLSVTFYQGEHFRGKSLRMQTGPIYYLFSNYRSSDLCHPLPKDWWDKASSMKTNGCVLLYSREDCTSSKYPLRYASHGNENGWIYKSVPDHVPNNDFTGHWINDNIRSFRKCKTHHKA